MLFSQNINSGPYVSVLGDYERYDNAIGSRWNSYGFGLNLGVPVFAKDIYIEGYFNRLTNDNASPIAMGSPMLGTTSPYGGNYASSTMHAGANIVKIFKKVLVLKAGAGAVRTAYSNELIAAQIVNLELNLGVGLNFPLGEALGISTEGTYKRLISYSGYHSQIAGIRAGIFVSL